LQIKDCPATAPAAQERDFDQFVELISTGFQVFPLSYPFAFSINVTTFGISLHTLALSSED
jgi:hypothetical protein